MQTKLWVISCFAVLFSACRAGFEAESTDPDNPNNNNVTLAELQRDIFSQRCAASGCHSGVQPAGGLGLDSATNTFNNTINITSQVSGIRRIIPNDAENSYLVQKIEGRAARGSRMPLNRDPLSINDINRIKSWINSGAQRARQSSLSSNATQIYSKSDSLSGNTYRLEIVFGREIDASVIQASNLEIEVEYEAYSLKQFPSDIDVVDNKVTAWLELEQTPLQVTTVFNHETAAPILDITGRVVDGNGDSEEGGKFVFKSLFKAAEANTPAD